MSEPINYQIKQRQQIPYGGEWRYRDPNSNQWIHGNSWDMLIDRIRAHRKANDFPIGLDFEKEIENQLCINHPDECEAFDKRVPRNRRLGVGDILRGTQVMIQHRKAGSPLVDKAEADRRAAICVACKYNVDFTRPCSGLCGELRDLVTSIVGGKGTPHDDKLKSCNICHCVLAASVHLPLDIQCSVLTDDMKLQFAYAKERYKCWKVCT